jgi:putative ABC transport system substrate-binding protein
MKNEIMILALSAMLFALCSPVWAQQTGKVPRIGYLTNTPFPVEEARNAFRQGLRELGYIEGKNIIIELRSGERSRERQGALAAELVLLNVDVIVAGGLGDIRAAKEATSTFQLSWLTVVMPWEAVSLPV